jgi:hypothetical protein
MVRRKSYLVVGGVMRMGVGEVGGTYLGYRRVRRVYEVG